MKNKNNVSKLLDILISALKSAEKKSPNIENTSSNLKKNHNILIVDEQELVYLGMQGMLKNYGKINICGYTQSADEAILFIDKNKPDLVISDIKLKGAATGLQLLKHISKHHPKLNVLIMSEYSEDIYAQRALVSGARGYITKTESVDVLIDAIILVLNGNIYVNDKTSRSILKRLSDVKNNNLNLSNRELQVLSMIGDGLKSKEIAKKLIISQRTVECHRVKIKQKLGLKSVTEMIVYAQNITTDHV